jgi:hypothetical protein
MRLRKNDPMGPDTGELPDRGPQSLTTASKGHSCGRCGRSLTGRKVSFCSDGCRMRAKRAREQEKHRNLLNSIEDAVEQLRVGLGCGDD